LAAFLATVASAMRPGGTVFFLDGRPAPQAAAGDALPPPDDQFMTRRLNDGRSFRVVKSFWSAARVAGRVRGRRALHRRARNADPLPIRRRAAQ
jgi:hypothetical protein